MKISSGGWKVIGFAVVFAAGVSTAYQYLKPRTDLPIYQPSDINPRLVDSSLQKTSENHHILNFKLVNQLGDTVDESCVKDKIFVVDFFFTSCQSICPKMTTQLSRVAKVYQGNQEFFILSHTVDPETDSVEVLKEYAKVNNVDPKQWFMLTGSDKEIYKLARKSYFVVIDEPSTEGPDFVHTENFALVDKQGRLRGFYDGTNSDEVDQLITDIGTLLKETK